MLYYYDLQSPQWTTLLVATFSLNYSLSLSFLFSCYYLHSLTSHFGRLIICLFILLKRRLRHCTDAAETLYVGYGRKFFYDLILLLQISDLIIFKCYSCYSNAVAGSVFNCPFLLLTLTFILDTELKLEEKTTTHDRHWPNVKDDHWYVFKSSSAIKTINKCLNNLTKNSTSKLRIQWHAQQLWNEM